MRIKQTSYNGLRPYIQTGDIVAFGGKGGFISRGIQFVTRSQYSHVAIVRRTEADRVVLMESTSLLKDRSGVIETLLSERAHDYPVVDVYRLAAKYRIPFNSAACDHYLQSVKGRPYDRRGAGLSGLGQWLRIPGRLRDDALFCSELADVAHCAGGLVYGKDRTPTPEELIRRPIYGSVHRIKGAL
jgi:surface antigen